jgi:hypothetical protein
VSTDTAPVTSQGDRDLLADVGLINDNDQAGAEPHAWDHQEETPT